MKQKETAAASPPQTKKYVRLSAEEWEKIKYIWEHDPREGYKWLRTQLGLKVSNDALEKRAKRGGWVKKISLAAVAEQAHISADSARANNVGQPTYPSEIDSFHHHVNVRADIIETHREEWKNHRLLFPLVYMTDLENGFNVARTAKTAAEAIAKRQESERKAWGLDAVVEDYSDSTAIDVLNDFHNKAVEAAEKMRQKIMQERGLNNVE